MRVKLHILLDAEEHLDLTVNAIKLNNKYSYKENDVSVSVEIKDNVLFINRKTSEYDILLELDKNKKTTSHYSVFGGTKRFCLNTKVKKLKYNDSMIEVIYNLEGNEFKYKLEVIS